MDSEIGSFFVIVAVVLALMFLKVSINIIPEYQRAVVFLLGRFWKVKGPGLVIIVPIIQNMFRIDMRTRVLDVPTQDIISRDNVSVRVNGVVYMRVVRPDMALIQVENYVNATAQLAQTTLRSILGTQELDDMLTKREQLNTKLREILDEETDGWGIKVTQVEIKDIDLNETMVKAMARQAEAERERRARVITAEGELQASYKIKEASDVLASSKNGMHLRNLQTLNTIANDKSNTIVFPLPTEIANILGVSDQPTVKNDQD
jgi:regulator of protease activity HflC (stomatin/prohibitin superfamily)